MVVNYTIKKGGKGRGEEERQKKSKNLTELHIAMGRIVYLNSCYGMSVKYTVHCYVSIAQTLFTVVDGILSKRRAPNIIYSV